eukprot:gene32118-38840_t
MSNDAAVQRTLAFIYSRGSQSQATALDPDKHYVSYNAQKAPSASTGDIFHPDKAVWDFDKALECLRPDAPGDVYVDWALPPFPSFEHALQASKFVSLSKHAEKIRSFTDVRALKKYVSSLKDTSELVADFAAASRGVGEKLLRDRVLRSRACLHALQQTGHKRILFKNAFNDTYWGVNAVGQGQNVYGQLLEQIREGESRARRGKLRIYFGASAGVGKTYAMLSAAQRERKAGRQVLAQVQGVDVFPQADTQGLHTLAHQGRTGVWTLHWAVAPPPSVPTATPSVRPPRHLCQALAWPALAQQCAATLLGVLMPPPTVGSVAQQLGLSARSL